MPHPLTRKEKPDCLSVLVCVNLRRNPEQPSCAARGGLRLAELLEQAVAERGLPLKVERVYCLGRCAEGPTLRCAPGGEFVTRAGDAELERLLAQFEGD